MSDQARRWMIAAVTAGVVAALLAACGDDLPDGVDGEVTDDWGGLAEPVGFVPRAQVCHADGYRSTAGLADYQPVGCGEPHLLETVHVGTFTDRAAAREAPPAPDSAEHRSAYRQCEEQAADYLGADFRQGRLWLGVATPSETGWGGGARWFRCDLVEIESVYGEAVQRQRPLDGALAGDSSLRLGCYRVKADGGEVSEMTQTGCDKSHQAEFVGLWRAPDDSSYPDHTDADAQETVYDGCREQVAGYVDVPADGDLIYRTGTIADWMSQDDWRAGDRAFRCYLWLPGRELTGSLAGGGTDALPVQTE